jgi:xylan 1,4-beta-xylosidase
LYAFFARLGAEVLARGEDHLVTRHPDGRLAILAWAPVDVTGRDVVRSHQLSLDLPLAGGYRPAGADASSGPSLEYRPNAATAFVLRSRVNEEAGNAWTAWSRMGRPASPRPRELDALREASTPAREHHQAVVADGRMSVELTLDQHEVTLVEVTGVVDETPSWWDEGRLLGLGQAGDREAGG